MRAGGWKVSAAAGASDSEDVSAGVESAAAGVSEDGAGSDGSLGGS